MADLRQDAAFSAAVASVREGIRNAASQHEVADALALVGREEGEHNLQGHAHSVVPLAVLVARLNPGLMSTIRARTDLDHDMGTAGSDEARDGSIWDQVKNATQLVIANNGQDVVSEELGGGSPQTVEDIATTYLSAAYGGGQTGGGGADTVLKRTLKLMAHMRFSV